MIHLSFDFAAKLLILAAMSTSNEPVKIDNRESVLENSAGC